MFHVDDRQIEPDPFPNLLGKTARSIHHMFADDGALIGHDLPFVVVQKARIEDLRVTINLGPAHPGTRRHSIGAAGGVGVTIGWGIKPELYIVYYQ